MVYFSRAGVSAQLIGGVVGGVVGGAVITSVVWAVWKAMVPHAETYSVVVITQQQLNLTHSP